MTARLQQVDDETRYAQSKRKQFDVSMREVGEWLQSADALLSRPTATDASDAQLQIQVFSALLRDCTIYTH